jgi:uncharacterized OsmC-like protein
MSDPERIRTAFERNTRALELRPGVGRGTAVTRVRLRDGLLCDVEDGDWSFVVDMSQKSGGAGSAPDPGVYGRAALGSCLAIGSAMWAARRNVPIAGLDVEVQADYDSAGSHGVGDVPAGYREVRCIVTVTSDAPEDAIRHLLDEADAHSVWHDNFRRPLAVRRELRLVAPAR